MRKERNTILSINIDNSLINYIRIIDLFNKIKPIAALVQDLPKIEETNINKLTNRALPRYQLITNTNKDAGILIDRDIVEIIREHRYSNNKITATGSSLRWIERKDTSTRNDNKKATILLISIYIRPRATHKQLEEAIKWIHGTALTNEGISRTIIMGDVNATNPLWAPIAESFKNTDNSYTRLKEGRGRTLAKTFKRLKLSCINDISAGPTFIKPGHSAYIDIAAAGSKIIRQWNQFKLLKVHESIHHKVISIQTLQHRTCNTTAITHESKIIKPELINEQHFTELWIKANPLLNNWEGLPRDRIINRMNRLTEILYEGLLYAQDQVTTIRKRITNKGRRYKLQQSNARTRKYISKTQKLEQKLKNGTKPKHEKLKAQKIKLRKKVKNIRNKLINEIDKKQIRTTSEAELWKRYKESEKEHKPETDIDLNVEQIKNQKDIDQLAEYKFPVINRKTQNHTIEAIRRNEQYKVDITEYEIEDAIQLMNKKKYTSPEGIRMQTFYQSSQIIKPIIKAIANMSFNTALTPTASHLTQGTLIPKKAPGQFRIVHVSSPIAALLETIALKRLEYRLEKNKLNSAYQFGFTTNRGRHDLIARLIELCIRHRINAKTKARTTVVSLDIEGAFDNVDQDELIHKMNKEFGKDPIKHWLTNFILDRKITIKIGTLSSKIRPVSRGVPQGSALGPILWNYMIHDIEKNITDTGKLELLKYADDIMIVYNGKMEPKDQATLQQTIDKLIDILASLKLNIRPEKCSVMTINVRNYKNSQSNNIKLKINGEQVKNCTEMNILGIPITNGLRLDTNSEQHKEKTNLAIRKLHNANRLNIVNSAKEWATLIDSLIISRLIINNWPILTIDTMACKWADKTLFKAARTIFNWPKNTCTNLIQVMMRHLGTEERAKRLLKEKLTSEFKETYKLLDEVNKYGRNIILKKTSINLAKDLEATTPYRRKHPEPDKRVTMIEIYDYKQAMSVIGPMWAILERKRASMMIELYGEQILQNQVGKHHEYPIPYFNTLALLKNIVSQNTTMNRNLLIHDTSALLMALNNINNHDWRIIEIREQMHNNGWRIYILNPQEKNKLTELIENHYKTLALKEKPNPHDFDSWLILMEELAEGNNESRQQNTRRSETRIMTLKEPYLDDYKYKNQLMKHNQLKDKSIYSNLLPKFTRQLCKEHHVWQQIPPNWLDGGKLLMLSGLISTNNGTLMKGDRLINDKCENCPIENNYANTELINKLGIDDTAIEKHLTLHRVLKCAAFKNTTNKYSKKIKEHKENTKSILMNRKESQTLLRLLAECAMNKRNN